MSNPERRLAVWVASIAGLGVLASVGPLWLAASHLPEPLASHFGISGAPDGALPLGAFAAVLAGLVLVPAVLAWPRRAALEAAAGRLALVGFSSTLSIALGAVTLWLNWERALWTQAAHFELWLLLPVIGLPLASGGVLGALARRLWPGNRAASKLGADALPLAVGERAYWSGGAQNRWLLLVLVGIMIEGGVFSLILPPAVSRGVLLLHLALLPLLELFSNIRVSVNERGLTIHYGHLGWLRQRVGLDRIARASAFELEPLAHGGWGYRGSLKLRRRAAVVVRSGSALRLELRDGAQLSVTVDDAETAARLLNGFVQRSAALPSNDSAALAVQP
ncbi:MAG TPA: hypothetical protein VJU61_23300 [Polyangiaceae bacterium]|nr:hypothetical protein [Polyangiaceae bacterium]